MDKISSSKKQNAKCEMCGTEVAAGLTLCETHWKVRLEEQLKSSDFMRMKKPQVNANT